MLGWSLIYRVGGVCLKMAVLGVDLLCHKDIKFLLSMESRDWDTKQYIIFLGVHELAYEVASPPRLFFLPNVTTILNLVFSFPLLHLTLIGPACGWMYCGRLHSPEIVSSDLWRQRVVKLSVDFPLTVNLMNTHCRPRLHHPSPLEFLVI